MGPDFRVLVAKARKSAQSYWKIYGEYPSTRVLVGEIATVMQEATQSGLLLSLSLSFSTTLINNHLLLFSKQWSSSLWSFITSSWLRSCQRSHIIPSRSIRFILALESKRNRKEPSQRQNFLRKTVRSFPPFSALHTAITHHPFPHYLDTATSYH